MVTIPTLYNRTISISRLAKVQTSGDAGYLGPVETNETVIFSSIPASIEYSSRGKRPVAEVPADTEDRTIWYIFTPANALALGAVLVRDIITDDLGDRYQVDAPYWSTLGYELAVERLLN